MKEPKKNLADAQTAADERRGGTKGASRTKGTFAARVLGNGIIATQLEANKEAFKKRAVSEAKRRRKRVSSRQNQSTCVFGICQDSDSRILFYACQGGDFGLEEHQLGVLKTQFGCADVIRCNPIHWEHAEMAIIEMMHAQFGLEDKNYSKFKLEIACVGKQCCADCAGYLNKYSIPHSGSDGKPSASWRHPVTHAIYRGGKTIRSYQKKTRDGKAIHFPGYVT